MVLQDLAAYLTERPGAAESGVVGAPLEIPLDLARYQRQVRFALPPGSALPSVAVDAPTETDGTTTARLLDTDRSGFYEAQLLRTDNATETRRYAVNVDPEEGDLRTVDGTQLAARLGGVKFRYAQAASFQIGGDELAGNNLGDALLFALVLLLVGEQILAWSASYHPGGRIQGSEIRGGTR